MSLGTEDDGGLHITPQMRRILDQSGLISIDTGSERLRNMFQTQYVKFDPNKLSEFALACMSGNYGRVKQDVESGTAPDLRAAQTPFLFGFVAFAALGALRLKRVSSDAPPLQHLDVISFLVASGAPLGIPDISGNTALHHACTPPHARPDVAKLLLEKGANVNAQNRFGEVPLFFSLQGGDVQLVNILMEHGASLDIADANGDSPRKMCVVFGAEVTAAVQRWERQRRGEVALLQEKRCENCKAKESGLKQCARCHTVRYCSTECQRAHWKVHKPACEPFSAETTVTLKPTYNGPLMSETVSKADLTRQMLGLATPTTRPLRPGLTKNETANKSMVIKIQVPVDLGNNPIQSALGGLFIYNKKRDFVCTVKRSPNPAAYDAVMRVVRSRGVRGAKAYFAAELKNPDELVVKISEVLAEQPF